MSRGTEPITNRGSIEAGALYPVAVFLKRLGIGRHSLTALRQRGLRVRMIGTRAFVDGQEALATLRRLWDEEDQAAATKAAEVQRLLEGGGQ